ncbi:MAG: GntR family transcriptional regulator, transcriptional repressor for pyruvate dehydrogenase complex [Clostridia bacterium]|jgi:GntR family transcriptional repressor for pyruvate dehydrogenase complex|nr:GntR family transcriptional regulator, transcriptional repressor for pyruvate dehydrogenase complex [Clostridia bacterium]MDN5324268.1 GntR family transcriptional regulator, transcriptional repressor for pyruvate dehydrogenase complex [Clostridia bacterium]
MFKPIYQEQESVYEKVVKRLKSSIVEGKLKPGDKLPAERILAQMLGISRTSLREALKLLSAEGLVDIKHGKGVFIAENEPDDIIQKFSSKIFVENDTLKDFFEIRKVLETQAAIWVAERGNLEQINNLENIVTKTISELTESKKINFALLAEHDMKFHTCLAETSGNAVLLRIMQNLIDLLNEARSQALSIPKRPYMSLEEHLQIIKAIKEKNPEKAGKAMLTHLKNVEKDIFPIPNYQE